MPQLPTVQQMNVTRSDFLNEHDIHVPQDKNDQPTMIPLKHLVTYILKVEHKRKNITTIDDKCFDEVIYLENCTTPVKLYLILWQDDFSACGGTRLCRIRILDPSQKVLREFISDSYVWYMHPKCQSFKVERVGSLNEVLQMHFIQPCVQFRFLAYVEDNLSSWLANGKVNSMYKCTNCDCCNEHMGEKDFCYVEKCLLEYKEGVTKVKQLHGEQIALKGANFNPNGDTAKDLLNKIANKENFGYKEHSEWIEGLEQDFCPLNLVPSQHCNGHLAMTAILLFVNHSQTKKEGKFKTCLKRFC